MHCKNNRKGLIKVQNVENYELKLEEAAKEQVYATFYDVHILSPLLNPSSLPSQSKEDKKSDNFTLRLPSNVRKELTEIAEQEGISISQLINNAIVNSIEKHHDQEEARQIFLESVRKLKNKSPQINKPLKMGDFIRGNPLRAYLREEGSK